MNVDDIADLKDELADQMAEIEERQEFFADAAKEGYGQREDSESTIGKRE